MISLICIVRLSGEKGKICKGTIPGSSSRELRKSRRAERGREESVKLVAVVARLSTIELPQLLVRPIADQISDLETSSPSRTPE